VFASQEGLCSMELELVLDVFENALVLKVKQIIICTGHKIV
jgi:hypothetical protein